MPGSMALGAVLQANSQSGSMWDVDISGLWFVRAEAYCRHRDHGQLLCAPAAGNLLSSSPLALLVKRWMKVVKL